MINFQLEMVIQTVFLLFVRNVSLVSTRSETFGISETHSGLSIVLDQLFIKSFLKPYRVDLELPNKVVYRRNYIKIKIDPQF